MNIINEEKNDKIKNKILNLSFNQDNSCFSVSTEKGFMIFTTYPYKRFHKRKMDGGIRHCEMLNRTNLLALIGGGEFPKFNPKKIVIWDDFQNKMISEIKFFSNIKNIKLKKDRIFVVFEKNIYIFDLKTLENIEIILTNDNPKGLFAVNNDPNKTVIVYLGKFDKDTTNHKGSIIIKNYYKEKYIRIIAHKNGVSYISINNDGTLLATSNEKGTTIKIFNCNNGNLLSYFKRGNEKAEINYICFDNLSNYLAVTSDRGTIHIWSLGDVIEKLKIIKEEKEEIKKIDNKEEEENEDEKNDKNDNEINENKINIEQDKDEKNEINEVLNSQLPKNKKHIFSHSERSFAQIKINSNKSICSFQKNNIIIVITYEGMYYQAQLDTNNGGLCKIIYTESLSNLQNINNKIK